MVPKLEQLPVPCSILDTDLYKFTMQQAILRHFPNAQATYAFTLRDKSAVFTQEMVNIFQETVNHFSNLSLTSDEASFLRTACPYFTPSYLEFLASYRFNPSQVHILLTPPSEEGDSNLSIEIKGSWAETILWEVPLMACLSEAYFSVVNTDWDYTGQSELAYEKAKTLLAASCTFSEFGTRRRRSYKTQDIVMEAIVRAAKDGAQEHGKGKLSGTSNVHLAHKYKVNPIGTIAHEWFMGIAALRGYENVNSLAMDLWEEVYPNTLLLALTDTFSSEAFYQTFVQDKARALRWSGLRQDSGDPYAFADRAKEVYMSLGIDPASKMIIFSDSLDVEKAVDIKAYSDRLGLTVSFGIGTFLTNDFRTLTSGNTVKSKALNMVIKLSSVDGSPCVKLSDDLTKNTGDKATVEKVKRIYGLLL